MKLHENDSSSWTGLFSANLLTISSKVEDDLSFSSFSVSMVNIKRFDSRSYLIGLLRTVLVSFNLEKFLSSVAVVTWGISNS